MTCSFERCEKVRYGRKDLCQSHDQQRRRGKLLTPLRTSQRGDSCIFDGCGEPTLAMGKCTAHYHQNRRTGRLKAQPSLVTLGRDGQGNKLCRRCEVWQAEAAFSPNAKTADKLARTCKTCRRDATTDARYQLAEGQYAAMLSAQGGACAVCRIIPGDHRLFVDHDHNCCPSVKTCGNCVRSLLCRTCNAGLGMFSDREDLLRAAADYLERHSRG